MNWYWSYDGIDGSAVEPATSTDFPSQGDAETFIGEQWRELLAAGVEAVTLRHGERVVYGPMSLRP